MTWVYHNELFGCSTEDDIGRKIAGVLTGRNFDIDSMAISKGAKLIEAAEICKQDTDQQKQEHELCTLLGELLRVLMQKCNLTTNQRGSYFVFATMKVQQNQQLVSIEETPQLSLIRNAISSKLNLEAFDELADRISRALPPFAHRVPLEYSTEEGFLKLVTDAQKRIQFFDGSAQLWLAVKAAVNPGATSVYDVAPEAFVR